MYQHPTEQAGDTETADSDPVPTAVDQTPGLLISFEDESDRAYRRLVELYRPETAP